MENTLEIRGGNKGQTTISAPMYIGGLTPIFIMPNRLTVLVKGGKIVNGQ